MQQDENDEKYRKGHKKKKDAENVTRQKRHERRNETKTETDEKQRERLDHGVKEVQFRFEQKQLQK